MVLQVEEAADRPDQMFGERVKIGLHTAIIGREQPVIIPRRWTSTHPYMQYCTCERISLSDRNLQSPQEGNVQYQRWREKAACTYSTDGPVRVQYEDGTM